MSVRSQALILTIFILLSLAITRIKTVPFSTDHSSAMAPASSVASPVASNLSYERADILGSVAVPRGPSRDWNVLDPPVKAEAVLIQSLDDYFPFFNYNTYKTWPLASLTKLLTAAVVIEDIGLNKKISITNAAVATEGEAGGLKSGEVYTAQDLLKIMLLTSSNDAAAAFEEYLGREKFADLINEKIRSLGMNQTQVYDASGLSDTNVSSASDLMRLTRYLLQDHPEIFSWTRLTSFLAEPINDPRTQNLLNIDPLASQSDFLGGKTGTSEGARENILAIFNHNNLRLAIIILGSRDRYTDADYFLNWLDKAYTY